MAESPKCVDTYFNPRRDPSVDLLFIDRWTFSGRQHRLGGTKLYTVKMIGLLELVNLVAVTTKCGPRGDRNET